MGHKESNQTNKQKLTFSVKKQVDQHLKLASEKNSHLLLVASGLKSKI